MRLEKHIPDFCKGPDAKYSGHILVMMPNHSERIQFMKRLNLKVDANGAQINDDIEGKIEAMNAIGMELIKEVHLVRVEDGYAFTMDDLQYDECGQKLFQEVSIRAAITGFNISKK